MLADKATVKVLLKYLDYAEVFFFELVIKLLVNTNMNKNIIKLIEDKQPPYRPIFSLKPVELKILKTCIETYLKTRFIWPFESLAGALIFFDPKLNRHFCLYIDYQGLNNLTIKNWYLLSLIKEALNRLD